MKLFTRITTSVFTVAIIAAFCATPQQAQAGDKEWATAGKVLIGIVALDLLTNHDVASSYNHRPRRRTEYRSNQCSTAPKTYRSNRWQKRYNSYHARKPAPVYRNHRPAPVYRNHRPAPVYQSYDNSCSLGPVIRYLPCGQRIYQERRHGHVAYVQKWDRYHNQWVTVRTCDSIY